MVIGHRAIDIDTHTGELHFQPVALVARVVIIVVELMVSTPDHMRFVAGSCVDSAVAGSSVKPRQWMSPSAESSPLDTDTA